jgi:nucleoside 2-deoxyribosyltransferase
MKKIFISIKHYKDNRNKSCIEAISSLLQDRGFQSVCMVRDYEFWGQKVFPPNELMKQTFEQIASCDLLLVETTVSGTGMGVEAGYAYAKGIPIITVAKDKVDIPVTLQGISSYLYSYKNFIDLGEFFDYALVKQQTFLK